MHEQRYQIIGLAGFILAGVLFIIAGLRAGDVLTTSGSVIWTLSCVIWLIPYLSRNTPR